MATDILAELADLPGVGQASMQARDAVDGLLWDRHARRVALELKRQSGLRGGWASAAIDGAEVPYESVLTGTIEDSPIGTRTLRTVALTTELPRLLDVYARSPLQAWAKMNTTLVAGLAPESEIGRPRPTSDVEDPLRIGPAPLSMETAQRLTALADLVVNPTQAPAVVSAGVVHGELAVLRPFRHASGPVARATIRLSLGASGLDPDLLTIPESAILTLGRSAYVKALRGYASGSAEGMADWLVWFSGAIGQGARNARKLAETLS